MNDLLASGAFSYSYFKQSSFVNGMSLSISQDYFMTQFGGQTTELDFLFSVGISNGQTSTHSFKLVIEGPINFCHDVTPSFSCQSAPCPTEQVFLSPDNKWTRVLSMREKANNWRYQELVESQEDSSLNAVWVERNVEVSWKTGDTECPLSWEPILRNE